MPSLIVSGERRISFSNTLGSEPSYSLLSGWKDRDMYGARMTGNIASLVFNFERIPDEDVQLELLVRLRTQSRIKARLAIHVNGIKISYTSELREGFSVHKMEVPYELWLSGSAPQVVVFELEAAPEALGQCEFTLAAICFHHVAAALPSPPAPDTGRTKAQLRIGGDGTTRELSTVRFGRGEETGWLWPSRGWSVPEDGFRWNDGPAAVLTLQSEANLPSGVAMIKLVGQPFFAGNVGSQQVNLRVLGTTHATGLRVDDHTEIEILVTAGSTGKELHAHILLEFPDAVSPSQLGLNEDSRNLAFMLQEASIERFEHCVSSTQIALERSHGSRWSGEPLSLPQMPAVLRLFATGPAPSGEFSVSHHRSSQTPTVLADGGWEVCFPLNGTHDVVFHWSGVPDGHQEVPLPQQLTVEVWSSTARVSKDTPTEARVSMVAGSDPHRPLERHTDEPVPSDYSDPLADKSAAQDDVTLAEGDAPVLTSGWSDPEAVGTWSDGSRAEIAMPPTAGAVALVASGHAFLPTPGFSQEVLVRDDLGPLGSLTLDQHSSAVFVLAVSMDFSKKIVLEFPNAGSPKDFGLSSDDRKLGILIETLTVVSLEPVPLSDKEMSLNVDGPIEAQIIGLSNGPLDGTMVVWLGGSGPIPDEAVCEPLGWRYVPERAENGWRLGMVIADAVFAAGAVEVLLIETESGEARATRCTLTSRLRNGDPDAIADRNGQVTQ
jgi:hypothetical protein